MTLKVSIVTISFNQADFLEEAILSVLNQSYDNIEYIIVDAGSTDGSREIIERYREQIDHIILEPDEGPADGLNKGFQLATGNIYGFLNADDMLLSDAILNVTLTFKQNSQYDVVSGHGIVINDVGKELRKVYSDRFSLVFSAYNASIIIQPSTFFRQSAYLATKGFAKRNQSNWDDELFVDMKINGASFLILNKFLSAYRLHAMSITGSRKLEEKIVFYNQKRFFKIMKRQKKTYDNYVGFIFQMLRHILNVRDTIERIKNGPIYGRYQQNKGEQIK